MKTDESKNLNKKSDFFYVTYIMLCTFGPWIRIHVLYPNVYLVKITLNFFSDIKAIIMDIFFKPWILTLTVQTQNWIRNAAPDRIVLYYLFWFKNILI